MTSNHFPAPDSKRGCRFYPYLRRSRQELACQLIRKKLFFTRKEKPFYDLVRRLFRDGHEEPISHARMPAGLLNLWMKKKKNIAALLMPHWCYLAIAFIAVIAESLTGLLEPWPLKIVFDYVISSKPQPEWMAGFVSSIFGEDKQAILHFAAASIVLIAIVGAISSYTEKYLTTSVAQ